MSLVTSLGHWSDRLAVGAPCVAGFLAALIVAIAFVSLPQPPEPESMTAEQPGIRGQAAFPVEPSVWEVFSARARAGSVTRGQLSKQFRLAGTFVTSELDGAETRKAVLVATQGGENFIAGENEMIREILVVRIQSESVVLRGPDGEEQLWLSFAGQSGSGERLNAGDPRGEAAVGSVDLAGLDRFGGKRIGERNWIFKRDAVMNYYRELRENPERLLKVFDSLKPVYTRDGKIEGYRLGIEGEAEFFQAVGLRENDVIHSVNSMQMTNRRRAEYFIREFVQERASAFVFDVERDGKNERLIYQIR